jgi:hypothetical protein
MKRARPRSSSGCTTVLKMKSICQRNRRSWFEPITFTIFFRFGCLNESLMQAETDYDSIA